MPASATARSMYCRRSGLRSCKRLGRTLRIPPALRERAELGELRRIGIGSEAEFIGRYPRACIAAASKRARRRAGQSRRVNSPSAAVAGRRPRHRSPCHGRRRKPIARAASRDRLRGGSAEIEAAQIRPLAGSRVPISLRARAPRRRRESPCESFASAQHRALGGDVAMQREQLHLAPNILAGSARRCPGPGACPRRARRQRRDGRQALASAQDRRRGTA